MGKLTVSQIEQLLDETGLTEEAIFSLIDRLAEENNEEKELKLSEVVKNLLDIKTSKKVLEIAGIDISNLGYWEVKQKAIEILVKTFLPVDKLQQQ